MLVRKLQIQEKSLSRPQRNAQLPNLNDEFIFQLRLVRPGIISMSELYIESLHNDRDDRAHRGQGEAAGGQACDGSAVDERRVDCGGAVREVNGNW